MKSKLLVVILGIQTFLFSLHSYAASTWIDNRYSHFTAPDKNQYKIGFGHIFENNAGILVSSIYDLGQPLGHFESSFQEIEAWHPIYTIKSFSFNIGALNDIDSLGLKIAPYVLFEYKYSNDLSLAMRYRYNHTTYSERDLNNELNHNDSHLLDIFMNYQTSEKLWFQFNPSYLINTNEFNYSNGKKSHMEVNVIARYQLNDRWMPYVELGWLDKNQKDEEQTRLRIGVRYYIF